MYERTGHMDKSDANGPRYEWQGQTQVRDHDSQTARAKNPST